MRGTSNHAKSTSGLAKAFAGLFLVLILAALGARFWLTDKAYDYSGPMHITAGAGDIYLSVSGAIAHLTADGELLEVKSLEEIGLFEDPIDLRLLENGELLIAGQSPATIHICQTGNWSCRALADPPLDRIQRQFKILPLNDPGRWLLTDARGDTLWQMDEAASELLEMLPAKTLAGANGLTVDAEGQLWVADTDNRRIVELLPTGDGMFETGREHSAVNELTIGERFYPMLIENGPDQRLWVAQAAEFSEAHSDLVIYDPEEGAADLITLPENAYATDLAVSENSVLVTDLERFTVYAVDGATRNVQEFGDAAFSRHLAGLQAQRDKFNRLGALALFIIVLAAAMMIFVVIRTTPREQRWSKTAQQVNLESAPRETPAVKGIHWLERNPKLNWMLKWYDRVFYLAFLALVVCALVMWFWALPSSGIQPSSDLGLGLLMMCLLVAAFSPLIHFSKKVMNRGLGSDGQRVHLRLENGQTQAVEPAKLFYSPRIILYRNLSFPITAGNTRKPLYREGEVEQWLGPLLRQSEKISEWQVLKHQFKYKEPLMLATAGALALAVVVLILMEVFLG